jgi:RNA recognition motif-containing protein
VGNLPYDATQEEIETLLREAGTEPVVRVYLPLDQDGRKRGFGFVTLGSAEVATAAIDQLKNAELRGRRLIINIAHPKGSRPEGGPPGGGFSDRPRSFGGPPGGGYGGPPGGGGGGGGGFGGPPPGGPPTARSGKGEGRKRKFDGPGEGGGEKGAAGGKAKREREERWRDQDDDDW